MKNIFPKLELFNIVMIIILLIQTIIMFDDSAFLLSFMSLSTMLFLMWAFNDLISARYFKFYKRD